MKDYIMLITYSFDSDYITIPCDTEEEAVGKLNKYLEEEVEIIKNEHDYEPIVKRHGETDIELIYTDDETVEDFADTAYYRVVETNHNYEWAG